MSSYNDYITTNRGGSVWTHPLYMRGKTRGGGVIGSSLVRLGKNILGAVKGDLLKGALGAGTDLIFKRKKPREVLKNFAQTQGKNIVKKAFRASANTFVPGIFSPKQKRKIIVKQPKTKGKRRKNQKGGGVKNKKIIQAKGLVQQADF